MVPNNDNSGQPMHTHNLAEQAGQGPQVWSHWHLLMMLVVALVLVAGAGATRHHGGDLYVALAGGRDIVDGKLGQGDEWSVLTEGRVWFNQNWGTHLVIYLAWLGGGDAALVMLKLAYLLGIACGVCLACRQRGVRWSIALLAAGGIVAACRAYLELAPNLSTMLLVPLVLGLLYQTRWRVHVVWAVAALVGIWANMHGGFVFGLGMMAFWTACRIIPGLMSKRNEAAWGERWPLPAAFAAAVALAALANPFGVENLTHPLAVTRGDAWLSVLAWRPLLATSTTYGSKWEFLTILGVLAALLIVRAIVTLRRRDRSKWQGENADIADRVGLIVFDAGLSALTIAMAFQSRRFVPLAALVTAPLVAIHLNWLIERLRRRWTTTALAVAMVVPAVLLVREAQRNYDQNHPFLPRQSVFQRMVLHHQFCDGVAEFLRLNNINGRVFNDWAWEGYLHWRCPKLRLFLGGRAQQIYTPRDRLLHDDIFFKPDPAALMKRYDLNLAILNTQLRTNRELLSKLVYPPRDIREEPDWVCIYCDGDHVVLANNRHAHMQHVVHLARTGLLEYPDAFTEAMSRGAFLASPGARGDPADALGAYVEASQHEIRVAVYQHMTLLATRNAQISRPTTEHFHRELARLESIDWHRPRGIEVLGARRQLTLTLAQALRPENRHQQVMQQRWRGQAHQLDKQIQELSRTYGFQVYEQ